MAVSPRKRPTKQGVREDRTKTPPQSLARELMERRRESGIPEVGRPELKGGFPEVPDPITGLHDEGLSELYTRMDAFAAFVQEQVAIAEVEALDSHLRLKTLESRLQLEALEATHGSATQRKLEAFLDHDAVELRQEDLRRRAEAKLLKSRLDGLERSIRILSREQTRREKVYERRRNS